MVRVMDSSTIEAALHTAEQSVAGGGQLDGTGFWQVVTAAKRDPDLADLYAERIAGIDRDAFRAWALLRVPLGIGTFLMVLGTAAGLALVAVAYYLDDLAAVLAFYAGFGVVLTTTHGLGHLVVGRLLGVGFTDWFIGTLGRPQPGVKIDYETYLRAPAASRAWMHASGAIVTKLVPFSLIGAAAAAGLPTWAVLGVGLVGVVTVVTDVMWSTKSSDWKKFRREMGFDQS